MSQRNYFLEEPKNYKRDLDIIGNANQLSALYLQKQTGKPLKECLQFVESYIEKNPLQPIMLKGLVRNDNQDRRQAIIPFDKLIDNVKRNNLVLAPNMVIYDSTEKNPSIAAKYIKNKMAKRKKVKKQGLEAYQRNDLDTFNLCNNEEYSIKILINSLSGACCNPHNPFYNKTAHSTLTSNTRVMVSYSNASTERFLSGNRHYWCKAVVLENILAIISNTNYEVLESVVNKYNLYTPSVEDVMKLINRCTKFYWRNENDTLEIKQLVETLSPIERIAYTYTGDFYHLTKFNDTLVKGFLTSFLMSYPYIEIDDIESVINNANPGVVTLAGIMCSRFLKGKSVSIIKEEMEKGCEEAKKNYKEYANTILNIEEITSNYGDLLRVLYFTNNIPSSIYAFPHSIRRVVVGSDTDSTMFTTQGFIKWYFGKLVFTPEADVVANVVGYLNNYIIEHILALISKQMGVSDENLFVLKMKNEYMFPIYLRANRAKHYATILAAREGLVYGKAKAEIKGVALKDSKIPRIIMNGLEEEFINVMVEITKKSTMQIYPLMHRIANLEHMLLESLQRGEITFLSTLNISNKEAYKNADVSKYMHYDLWQTVWGEKYGNVSAPPYRAVKVSTCIDNPTKTKKWIDSLDSDISGKLLLFMQERNRKDFANFLLPYEIVANGLPPEFINIVDTRKIVSELVAGHYILLECLGFYFKNNDNTRLLSDTVKKDLSFGLPGETHNS